MADAEPHGTENAQAAELDGGTYEVIRRRLEEQGNNLRTRVDQLNLRRQELFGGSEVVLQETHRVRTEHNCVPRDIVPIGPGRLLLGYHVVMGLKSEVSVSDAFAEYAFTDEGLEGSEAHLLDDGAFEKDFKEVFTYFKDARLTQLRRTPQHLLMIFQTGRSIHDTKVLRWGINGDHIAYIDNRGERDHVYPPAHDFEWVRTTREMNVYGAHPHVNINDTVFVEAVGGDLTIKVEDNTESGSGVYAEPVDEVNQGLDDAEIYFADLEAVVLIKIRPYREDEFRYIVFNKQTKEAVRIDAIGQSCQELPEGHGIIFPGGYFLANGSHKVFPLKIDDMEFKRRLRAPNGEDVAYIFYDRTDGVYAILHYNVITREVANPQVCNGFSLFPDGRLVVFSAEAEPQRMHTMNVWATPFVSEEVAAAAAPADDSFLATVGNRDLVRGISDLLHVNRQIANQRASQAVYEDMLVSLTRIIDGYHWLGHDEAFGLRDQAVLLRETAGKVIGEFEKVQQLRSQADAAITALETETSELFRAIALDGDGRLDGFVQGLTGVRAKRGQVDTARGLRYADLARLDGLDERLVKQGDELSRSAVDCLLQADALVSYTDEIADMEERGNQLQTVADAGEIAERLDAIGGGLDLLMEVVGALAIDDATQRTAILESISEVYALLNRAKAVVEARRKELGASEGRAEFGAQFKILGQSAANYLGLCDAPAKCDEFLAKLMVQLEELEARFIDFEEFTEQLAAKREEIYDSFQGRKQTLIDGLQKRAAALLRSGERIIGSVSKRTMTFDELDAINAYFASDPMVMKLRAIIVELRELDDSVKADDLEGRLKATREEAVRHQRDQSELFDGDTLKLGRHTFSVNRQDLELTLVPHDGSMTFHLTGTGYHELVDDDDFLATERFWDQSAVSENADVYRAEYLAYLMLLAAESGVIESTEELATMTAQNGLLDAVRRFAAERYDEGYDRGVHDADAARILEQLLALRSSCGLLRFPASARALAQLFWLHCGERAEVQALRVQAVSLGALRKAFGRSSAIDAVVADLAKAIGRFVDGCQLPFEAVEQRMSAGYLFEELTRQHEPAFVLGSEAVAVASAFREHIELKGLRDQFAEDLAALIDQPAAAWQLVTAWVDRFVASEATDRAPFAIGAALDLLAGDRLRHESVSARTTVTVEGLLGQHARIENQQMLLQVDTFEQRLAKFAEEEVPAYRAYQELRRRLVSDERERLRLDEFKPRVLTSFVRNRLINEVYLPIIGDNLAKQMGTIGDNKRTDLMGMLLLISPPGYGKTTLMEYVSSILGLTFMKINGPALGHHVVSLDPSEAGNATAAQELQKLNLALEMGNNVMIYLDDIQHCNPELLQKFISLCDGQRRIEGVWRGKTRTYDLRGRKVAVVMAGNPYTESGESFRIPDMLANRADTYNLGDILGGHAEAFELSYLENCLTANPVLNPVASRGQSDFYRLLRIAEGDDEARADLEHPYSAVELDEIGGVLRKLRRVQRVLLAVNQLYIESAATADDFRTEPPFKLQGSYRNMAKLAEKVVAVMTDDELERLILDHYQGESQTLTSEAEANMLRFKQLLGEPEAADAKRWEEITRAYRRSQEVGAGKDDPAALAAGQLITMNQHLADLSNVVQGRDDDDRLAQIFEAVVASQGAAGSAIERGLADLAQALTEQQVAGGQESSEAGVQIVNTLPKYYGRLYQHHIDVIKTSLAPALQALSNHIGKTDEINSALSELIGFLRGRLTKQDEGATFRLGDDAVDSVDAFESED